MPKQYSSKDVISILTAEGFKYISQKGSHMKFRKDKFVLIVPAGRKCFHWEGGGSSIHYSETYLEASASEPFWRQWISQYYIIVLQRIT